VDYNASPVDREYIPRNYVIKVPFGSAYQEVTTLQPYLLKVEDGVVPTLYVVDSLKRALSDIDIEIYKYIDNKLTLVEEKFTDATGKISFSAYPLNSYYIKLYYDGELKNTYKVVPRSTDDEIYLILDLLTTSVDDSEVIFNVNLDDTEEYFTYPTAISVEGNIKTNKSVVTSYKLDLYQGSTLLDTTTVEDTSLDIDIDESLSTTSYDSNTSEYVTVYLTVYYTINGSSSTKIYKKIISHKDVNSLNLFRILKSVPDDIGHLLSIIFAILVTIFVVGGLSMSGLNLDISALMIFGLFILGFFMFVGWLDTGITVLGFDTGKFLYILLVLFSLYYLTRRINY